MFFKRKKKRKITEDIKPLPCPICGGEMTGFTHGVGVCTSCDFRYFKVNFDLKNSNDVIKEYNEMIPNWPYCQIEYLRCTRNYINALKSAAEHKFGNFSNTNDENVLYFNHFVFSWSEENKLEVYMVDKIDDELFSNINLFMENNKDNFLLVYKSTDGIHYDEFVIEGPIKDKLQSIFDDIVCNYNLIVKETILANIAKKEKEDADNKNKVKKFEKILEEEEIKNEKES